MSTKDVAIVIARAGSDKRFLSDLKTNPDMALSGYSLTTDERAALVSGDPVSLEALGVDVRISKGGGFWGG